jgi:hypothetical protein
MTSTFLLLVATELKLNSLVLMQLLLQVAMQYRKIKMFNRLVSIIDSANKSKVTMLLNLEEKHSLENVTITNIVTSTTRQVFCFEFRNRYCIDYYNKRFY